VPYLLNNFLVLRLEFLLDFEVGVSLLDLFVKIPSLGNAPVEIRDDQSVSAVLLPTETYVVA